MKAKYLVVIERGQSNFSAYSPDLPGCIATGKTVEETLDEMRSAIVFHLEGMLENDETIPVPRSLYSYVHETDEISDNDIITSIETEIPHLVTA
jgi:predicted RNase H-like HicB family nuclease